MLQSEEEDNDSSADSQGKTKDEFIGSVLPGGHKFNKKLVCIKYPANVVNPEKAVETLGGLPDISSV